MFKLLVSWIGTLLILMASTNHASVPQVVVTIKPIHALVSGIMDGVGTPYLLLRGGESPHNYNLHPSQVRRLHAATLVIWVGPTMERFLKKILTTLSDNTQILRLIEVTGLTLLKVRKGKAWEMHHGDEFHHNDHHHTEFEIDPHIWLSPYNAKILVQIITQTLGQIDTKNAARYTANATHLIEQLESLDQTLKQQLAPLQKLPYLVFHDAYQYFEHRYGLMVMGSVTLSPEIYPSVKRVHQLRTRLINEQIHCVFSEPQFESALVTPLIEGTSTRRGVLDPLGVQLVARTESYFTLLRNLANSLTQCLQMD